MSSFELCYRTVFGSAEIDLSGCLYGACIAARLLLAPFASLITYLGFKLQGFLAFCGVAEGDDVLVHAGASGMWEWLPGQTHRKPQVRSHIYTTKT